MRYTNRHGLPPGFLAFAENDPYSKGDADYSITELMDAPQISQLRKRWGEHIETDVSDAIFTLLGSAMHAIAEGEVVDGDDSGINERRFFADVAGKRVSGAVDRIQKIAAHRDVPWEDKPPVTLIDYKMTSARSMSFSEGGVKKDWTRQLNCYAYLAKQGGFNVQGLAICAVARDWQRSKVTYEKNYPIRPITMLPVSMASMEMVEDYLVKRVELHEQKPTPPCTMEDRWINESKWAVMKHGLKRATKVCDSRHDAESFIIEKNLNAEVVERPGKPERCENWCEVSRFCEQWKSEGGGQ